MLLVCSNQGTTYKTNKQRQVNQSVKGKIIKRICCDKWARFFFDRANKINYLPMETQPGIECVYSTSIIRWYNWTLGYVPGQRFLHYNKCQKGIIIDNWWLAVKNVRSINTTITLYTTYILKKRKKQNTEMKIDWGCETKMRWSNVAAKPLLNMQLTLLCITTNVLP